MRSITLLIESFTSQVETLRVITCATGSCRTVLPLSAIARTISRSDRMPARRPLPSRTTSTPMRCVKSNFAAAARSAVGSMQMTCPRPQEWSSSSCQAPLRTTSRRFFWLGRKVRWVWCRFRCNAHPSFQSSIYNVGPQRDGALCPACNSTDTASGHKRKIPVSPGITALLPKADIPEHVCDVHYAPLADIIAPPRPPISPFT
jgi:hypothetical protein